MTKNKPEILAPAGDRDSYLAAVAAGADAVYVGLKHFSARMQAKNFSISELAALASLGRERGVKTYVAMNTLVKPGDVESAGRLIMRLAADVKPDALIFQDLAMPTLAKQTGFKGELHLSTLANLSNPAGLAAAAKIGIDRAVLPRELNLDEIKQMAAACPKSMDLEVFVHGALCHCVSGRCYWSSFLGGKSGLRGRCVQPCRRLYRRTEKQAKPDRLFSCMDLSLDVLTKPLLDVPKVGSWKIEGRKKGPHYVFYTTKAYTMLRDNPDAQGKKMAQELLEMALGRPTSHSVFLPQRPFVPVTPGQETASGRFVGQVKREGKRMYFQTREELLPGDMLRVGYEDQKGHRTIRVRKRIPRRGRFDIMPAKGVKGPAAPFDAKVFLVDRREKELETLIKELGANLPEPSDKEREAPVFKPKYPKQVKEKQGKARDISVFRTPPNGRVFGDPALWLDRSSLQSASSKSAAKIGWWMPPVIWPDEEKKWRSIIREAVRKGAKRFVLNAPWQVSLFTDHNVELTAGPFCNVSNRMALGTLKDMGFKAAYVSPELNREETFAMLKGTPLPLGMVIRGLWPFGISRILAEGIRVEEPLRSPMNEVAWIRKHGENYWIYPGWELDLTEERRALEKAGFRMFATMREFWPKAVPKPSRTSTFNWKIDLL
ncbi:peptidase U32 family protein [Desulfovibrio oxyclinae]|uniref:peptidase U32 family protein n=1 Tax=Desulfovibrio oxyclinae TaxID=63560 RepID=UPI000368D90A|nr:peptidase U32 family protein [Desulfovibrio oxyclinae]